MHRDAVGDLGDDAEIMGDEQHAGACSRCRSRISFRICAWVVTSSAVVGSSAISTAGRAPAPSRSWRADAGRRTIDADRRAHALGIGQATSSSSASALRAALGAATDRRALEHLSIWSPMRISGLSAVIGSWKTMAMPAPRRSRACRRRLALTQIVGLRRASRPPSMRHALRQQPHQRVGASSICRTRTRRPRKDFAGGERQRHAVHGLRPVGTGRQADCQSRSIVRIAAVAAHHRPPAAAD